MANKEAEVSKGKGRKRGVKAPQKNEVEDVKAEVNKVDESPMKPNGTTNGKIGTAKRKRNSSGVKNNPSKALKSGDELPETPEDKVKEEGKEHGETKGVNSKATAPKQAQKGQEKKKGMKNQPQTKVDKDQDSAEEKSIKEEDSDLKNEKVTASKTTEQKSKKNDKGEPVPRPMKYESLGEGPPPVPATGKMYVGCHVSGAGGLWNAFDNATECKAKSFALFLRNQRRWVAKPLDDGTVDKWQKAMKDMPAHLILPHGSYLMNIGSPDQEVLEKSRGMLLEEIQRCEKLGIPHYNFHPGSTRGKISREECCKTIAESINLICEQTKGVIFVLESMSCQGFTIGGDLHELRTIIEHVKDKTRVGVCLDTCHAHASGYDLGTKAGFEKLIEDFSTIIGWQFLRALHVNDSKGKSGDHLDRHETIGKGTIGKEGFRRIMNCKYFQDMPIVLETPWTDNAGYAKEIKILEGLIAG